jgi:hypothetical protein
MNASAEGRIGSAGGASARLIQAQGSVTRQNASFCQFSLQNRVRSSVIIGDCLESLVWRESCK